MTSIPEYTRGRRDGVKWAVAWLHGRADEMNDTNAKAVLNTAAFNLGNDAQTTAFIRLDDVLAEGGTKT